MTLTLKLDLHSAMMHEQNATYLGQGNLIQKLNTDTSTESLTLTPDRLLYLDH